MSSYTTEPPKDRSLIKSIMKQVLVAFFVAGVVLAIYLIAVNSGKEEDRSIGKYAYIAKKGEYVGKIKGHGRSSSGSNEVYFIQQPTGELIEISDSYIEVRDKPPNSD
jgi:hypothetical protein